MICIRYSTSSILKYRAFTANKTFASLSIRYVIPWHILSPLDSHCLPVKRILRYFKGTITWGLHLKHILSLGEFIIETPNYYAQQRYMTCIVVARLGFCLISCYYSLVSDNCSENKVMNLRTPTFIPISCKYITFFFWSLIFLFQFDVVRHIHNSHFICYIEFL